MGIDLETLAQAVLRWTGYGTAASPLRQDAAITDTDSLPRFFGDFSG